MSADKTSIFKTSPIFPVSLCLTAAIGVCWRLDGLGIRGFEYDEFWTLTHYVPLSVSDILADLATPNNHPLNSVLIKWSVSAFGVSPLSTRLPAFIAGTALLIPVSCLAWWISESKTATLLTLAIFAANGAMIHFSQTARGYSTQLLLLASLAALMVHHVKSGRESFQFSGGIVALAGFAIFALPTSILFIVPFAALHLAALAAGCAGGSGATRYRNIPRNLLEKHGATLAAYAVLAILAAFWYGVNYSEFKAGQGQFSGVASLREWLAFVGRICAGITSPIMWLAALIPLFFRKWRWLTVAAIFTALFPFLLVPLTKAGPARVYLPILIPVALSASVGTSLMLKRFLESKPRIFGAAIILLLAAVFADGFNAKNKWTPIDWRVATGKLRSAFGRGVYIAYPPNACYAVLANFGPEAVVDAFARLPRNEGDSIVLVGEGSALRGLDADFQPSAVELPIEAAVENATVAGLECRRFVLSEITAWSPDAPPSALLISIHPWSAAESKRVRKEISEALRDDGVIMCDAWLSRKWLDRNGVEHVGYLLACPADASNAAKQFVVNGFAANPGVSFFILR